MMMHQKIASNITSIDKQIRLAEIANGRLPHSVTLLAVSKTQTINSLREALSAGQCCFGENYVQEAIPKILALKNESIEWHFIGGLQANKTRSVAENFSWVQSLYREDIAQRLNDQRPVDMPFLNVCIEVNLGNEPQKGGIPPEGLSTFAQFIVNMPRLRLRGLMAIPPSPLSLNKQHEYFKLLKQAFDKLRVDGFAIDTLSMGMSQDWEAAIAEGATMIRLGTAIFGERKL